MSECLYKTRVSPLLNEFIKILNFLDLCNIKAKKTNENINRRRTRTRRKTTRKQNNTKKRLRIVISCLRNIKSGLKSTEAGLKREMAARAA